MARSKAQMTHAKRDRERARLEKRARKQEKKDARKQTTPNGEDGIDGAGSTEDTPDGAPPDQ
jgi:hypothetical protein